MSETKAFPTRDVLGAVTGVLLGDFGAMHKVVEWMAGGPVWTHQLPRVGKEITAAAIAKQPDLAKAVAEAEQVTPENWRHWLGIWVDRYGPEIAVPRMSADQHEDIDPLSELVEKVHPDRIVVI